MMAVMGLIDHPGRITAYRLTFDGQDLLSLKGRRRRHLIGKELSMVFQDPMTALNPSYTVGFQLEEVIRQHLGLKGRAARQRALELLEKVEIPAAASRLGAYPHQLSGGMSQRVAIAMAIAAEPRLLIADEPTTALDVTVQAQILALLDDLRGGTGTSVLLITHDLGVVADHADEVVVMYAGRVAETGPAAQILAKPQHPYTVGLLGAAPRLDGPRGTRLATVEGTVPDLASPPEGCRFKTRCPFRIAVCDTRPPLVNVGPGHRAACHRAPLDQILEAA
jgi:oligopeptide/dipeptide ABC transporter ATP-binding protein